MMTHLTHTGYYAGLPFCPVDKSEAVERGERFIHPPYAPQSQWAITDLCPECMTVWNEAASDEDDE